MTRHTQYSIKLAKILIMRRSRELIRNCRARYLSTTTDTAVALFTRIFLGERKNRFTEFPTLEIEPTTGSQAGMILLSHNAIPKTCSKDTLTQTRSGEVLFTAQSQFEVFPGAGANATLLPEPEPKVNFIDFSSWSQSLQLHDFW